MLQNEPTPTPEDGAIESGAGVTGEVTWILTGPDGQEKGRGKCHNTITAIGDQVLGERGAGLAGAPAAPNGMKLGTGATAAAKTGAGAASIAAGTYLADSHVAFSVTPTSGPNGALRKITYTGVWAAGKATTASPITEAVIVNDYASGTNSTSALGNTLSRVVLTPAVGSKGAQDSLTLIWDWNVGT